MTSRDVFGIIVRSVGLVLFFIAIWYGFGAFFTAVGFYKTGSSAGQYFVAFVLMLFFGLYFLRGAPAVLQFSYPDESAAEQEAPPPAV